MTKPAVETVELPLQTREARFQPSTVNEEARTVDLCWTTGATVRRRDFFGDAWDEQLMLDEGAVRMDRLNSGASVLDSHSSTRLSAVLGVVERAWMDGNGAKRQGWATVRFSDRADVEPIWRDVRSGIIRNVSVGYAIHRVDKDEKAKIPLVRVVDWEPYELSMVAVPADAGAKVRSQQDERRFPCVVERTATMADQATSAATNEVAGDKAPPKLEERKPDNKGTNERNRDDAPEQQQRAETEQTNGDARAKANGHDPEPVPTGPTAEQVRQQIEAAVQADRERADAIRLSARVLKFGSEVAERLIKSGSTLATAQSELVRLAAERQEALEAIEGPVIRSGEQDEDQTRAKAITSAILHRYSPGQFNFECGGERFNGMALLELARHCLEEAGVRTWGFSRNELARRAMLPGYGERSSGLHTTSDFAAVLADVANKTLRQSYTEAPRTFLPFCRRTTMPDFKITNRTQLGEAPQLLRKNEHGEFVRGTLSDARESYKLDTFGRVFGITREVLVNDDLDAFTRLPALFGASAARKENDIVWAVILANAAMGDGIALFHVNHGNLKASASGPPSITTVGAARASMSKQTGLDGALISAMARFILVPPELETTAEQLVTAITPNLVSSVVPPSIRSLTVISEPRLSVGVTLGGPGGASTTYAGSATAWYLAASPGEIDTVEYAYLEGEEGVMIDSRIGFDVDGVEIRAKTRFRRERP